MLNFQSEKLVPLNSVMCPTSLSEKLVDAIVSDQKENVLNLDTQRGP